MKKRLVFFLLAFLFFPISIHASESIPLTNTIEKTDNPMNVSITYELKKHPENPSGVQNVPEEITVDFSGVEANNHKLTKTVNIDFSNVEFPETGIYRYGLTQKSVSDDRLVKSDLSYEIYVTVTRVNGEMVKEVNPLALNFEEAGKEDILYRNTTNYTYIIIENRLDGELKERDRDTYFRYQISIEAPTGNEFYIIGQDEEVIFNGKLVETSNKYIVGENGNDMYVYLKDGQSITIGLNPNGFYEIPIGIRYTIKKSLGDKWLTRMNSELASEKTYTTKSDNNHCVIVNKRDYDSAVTGLFYTTVPFLTLILMVLLGIIVVISFSQKKAKDYYR